MASHFILPVSSQPYDADLRANVTRPERPVLHAHRVSRTASVEGPAAASSVIHTGKCVRLPSASVITSPARPPREYALDVERLSVQA